MKSRFLNALLDPLFDVLFWLLREKDDNAGIAVRAGLRNAKAKGKRIGRPRQEVDSSRVHKLRAEGVSWRAISEQLNLGLGTVYRALGSHPKG